MYTLVLKVSSMDETEMMSQYLIEWDTGEKQDVNG